VAESDSAGSIAKFIVVLGIIGGLSAAYLYDEQNNSKPKDPGEDDAVEVFSAFHATACGMLGQATADAVLQKAIENAQGRAAASGMDPRSQIDHLNQEKQDGWEYSRTAGCSGIYAPVGAEQSAMAFIMLPGEGGPSDTANRPAPDNPGPTAAPPNPVQEAMPTPSDAPGTSTPTPQTEKDQTSVGRAEGVPATAAEQSPIGPPVADANAPGSDAHADLNSSGRKGQWYYCDPLRMYYPYAQTCPAPWRPVLPASGSGTMQGQPN
jgi:hypothetical protein